MCVGLILLSFTENYWLFVIVFAIYYGLFKGMSYYLIISYAWNIYSEIKAKISGYTLFVYACAPFYYNNIITFIMNPDNKKAISDPNREHDSSRYFDESVYNNLPLMFRVFALLHYIRRKAIIYWKWAKI